MESDIWNENENYIREIKHIGLISVAVISFIFSLKENIGTHGAKEWYVQ